MKRLVAALVPLILVALLPASVAIVGVTASDATSLPQHSHSAFRVYLPGWLPSGFRQVHDPEIARYPGTTAKFFMRRYGVQGRWVSIFEGPAGCCLDGVPSHRVGPTTLSHRRTAYASDQGPKFGGLYLFWDQDHTYIAFNSPNLSKQILMRIAQSVTPTSYGDMKFSRPPFPSPARYLAVDEFPDGRYRAYAHRLADRLVRVKGYIPTRKLSIVAPDRDCVYHFASGCEPPIRWSFAGGWLNHPVATIQYIRPGSRARG